MKTPKDRAPSMWAQDSKRTLKSQANTGVGVKLPGSGWKDKASIFGVGL